MIYLVCILQQRGAREKAVDNSAFSDTPSVGVWMLLLLASGVAVATAVTSSIATHNFFWRGQFAGFIVSGQFSYDQADIPSNGIIREEQLLGLDVSFFDPQGTHLRTYTDNHLQPVDSSGRPYVNFAFDTISQELLQDGTFNVDDDENRYRNGFVIKSLAVGRSRSGRVVRGIETHGPL